MNKYSGVPTIRIAEDIFEGLKKLAEPLVDTPGDVIRRLLIEKGILKDSPQKRRAVPPPPSSEKALTPDLTPQHDYELFLLHSLAQDFGGMGDKRSVTQAVVQRMVKQGFIGPAELELVATGETRAENTITWGRNALKNRGLIARGTRRGTWELTEEGREAAATAELPRSRRR